MELNQDFRQLCYQHLRQEEGVRNYAYLDTKGYLTIGVGWNCIAHNTKSIIGRKITKVGEYITDVEVQRLFDYSLNWVINGLDERAPWWRKLDNVRAYIMISLTFNMGIGWIGKFPRTIRLIKAGNYTAAADALADSLWYRQVKSRGVKLVAAMRTGKL